MPTAPTVEILDVTPEMAETWLSKNPNNRNVRKNVVDAYARDMATGSWRLNGETVGGHRLNETEAVALTIVAWNAYRTGGTRTKLQLPKGGLTAKNYPEPR